MIHLVLNHESEVARYHREGAGPLFVQVASLFPKHGLHAVSVDWVYDPYRVATFRGHNEDVIVGWEGVHAGNS